MAILIVLYFKKHVGLLLNVTGKMGTKTFWVLEKTTGHLNIGSVGTSHGMGKTGHKGNLGTLLAGRLGGKLVFNSGKKLING